MRDAFGRVQSLLLLGGSSEIGLAIARRVVADGCRTVVLAGRSTEAMGPGADELRTAGAGSVSLLAWDALGIWRGLWWYSPDYTTGIRPARVPLEEYVFFVVIPICGLLTYEAVGTVLGRVRQRRGRDA